MLHFVASNASKLRSYFLPCKKHDRDPAARYPLIIEDTSLVFTALKQSRSEGLPGPYIKWFLENLGTAAIAAISFFARKKTRPRSLFGPLRDFSLLRGPNTEPELYTGTAIGTILAPTSSGGFGWDNYSCRSAPQ